MSEKDYLTIVKLYLQQQINVNEYGDDYLDSISLELAKNEILKEQNKQLRIKRVKNGIKRNDRRINI